MINGFFSIIIAFLTRSVFISTILSAIITWTLLAFGWRQVMGENIPVAAIILSFLAFYGYGIINKNKFNENAKIMMGGQLIGIIIFGILYCIKVKELNWY